MQRRLEGKRAVIVGGGQTRSSEGIGNGRATALRFAEEGAAVYVTARHLESAQKTAALILERTPDAKVFTYALDVTDEEEVKRMLADAADKMGGIDVMVNNVGIMMHSDTSLMTVDADTYQKMSDTNEKSALLLNRSVFPYMQEKGGAIVQIASIAGVNRCPNMYGVTKAGMLRLGDLFAHIYAKHGIRVNSIVLGMVETPMGVDFNVEASGKSPEEVRQNRRDSVPLKKCRGTAWDTANAALFLASDEAQFITGAQLPVDGGATIAR